MTTRRPLIWIASSLDDLKQLPAEVRTSAGFALDQVQQGFRPVAVKSMTALPGVQEIRINFDKDTYRVVFVINLGKNLYVLHSFQKKSASGISTPQKEIEKIRVRLTTARMLAKKEAEDETRNKKTTVKETRKRNL